MMEFRSVSEWQLAAGQTLRLPYCCRLSAPLQVSRQGPATPRHPPPHRLTPPAVPTHPRTPPCAPAVSSGPEITPRPQTLVTHPPAAPPPGKLTCRNAADKIPLLSLSSVLTIIVQGICRLSYDSNADFRRQLILIMVRLTLP